MLQLAHAGMLICLQQGGVAAFGHAALLCIHAALHCYAYCNMLRSHPDSAYRHVLDLSHRLCLQVSLLHRREVMKKEHRVLLGLHELLTYGLKGVAAYAHHAEMLGKVDPELDNMYEEVSASILCAKACSAA